MKTQLTFTEWAFCLAPFIVGFALAYILAQWSYKVDCTDKVSDARFAVQKSHEESGQGCVECAQLLEKAIEHEDAAETILRWYQEPYKARMHKIFFRHLCHELKILRRVDHALRSKRRTEVRPNIETLLLIAEEGL